MDKFLPYTRVSTYAVNTWQLMKGKKHSHFKEKLNKLDRSIHNDWHKMEVVRLSPFKTQGYQDKNYMRPTVTFSSYAKQAEKERARKVG